MRRHYAPYRGEMDLQHDAPDHRWDPCEDGHPGWKEWTSPSGRTVEICERCGLRKV